MSVRVRLTLWYVAVLCLGLGLFAGAVLWQTDRAADAALDATLARRARDVAADLRLHRGQPLTLRQDAPDEGVRQPGDTSLLVRVLDTRGRVAVTQGPRLPGLPASFLADTRAGRHDATLAMGRTVRQLVLPVVRQGRRVATVQVLTTTAALDAVRGQLLAAMGLAGSLLVMSAALGGLALADRALRPVDRITRLAASIEASDLHRRVGNTLGRTGSTWATERRRPDELGRLVATFDGMLARLEDAAAARRQLSADVAHELGTPIATIGSAAEIALRHPRSSDEYRAVLQQVAGESRQMGRLVEDLLLLARADAGQLPMEREIVEVDEVCRQAVRAYAALARERDVTLRACLPREALLAVGDEGRLGQVVRNLLDNALRHTPTGGTVTVTVEVQRSQGSPAHHSEHTAENRPGHRLAQRAAHSGGAGAGAGYDGPAGCVVLRVRDTGPGIAAHERERVFERFHRAQPGQPERPVDGQRAGSGLGLAICRAIVQAHGGQIRVAAAAEADGRVGSAEQAGHAGHLGSMDPTGTPESGAEFIVTLPRLRGATSEAGVDAGSG